jgi:hypothetical protein
MTTPEPETPVAVTEERIENDDVKVRRSVQRLSSLQRQILAMARANRVKEGRTDETRGGADLYYWEVLATVYGFPPTGATRYPENYGDHAGQRIPGGQKFDRQAIGTARYNRAQAAVSRAMSRLGERGLIACLRGRYCWSGCSLAKKGLAFCETVKTTELVQSC